MLEKSTFQEYVFIILFLTISGFIVFKLFADKKYEESLLPFSGEGDSMAPTILDGEEIIADPNKEPEINDIIVFNCEKCKIDFDEVSILTKRLLKKNDKGCFWVEGDNKEKSYDSRNFGWLCPNEIEYYGVVLN